MRVKLLAEGVVPRRFGLLAGRTRVAPDADGLPKIASAAQDRGEETGAGPISGLLGGGGHDDTGGCRDDGKAELQMVICGFVGRRKLGLELSVEVAEALMDGDCLFEQRMPTPAA